MIDGQLVSDVPAGEVITSFVQAALGAHEVALQVARQRVVDRLGWERFVDLTAVMAMFELNTRAADAIGINDIIVKSGIRVIPSILRERSRGERENSLPRERSRVVHKIIKPGSKNALWFERLRGSRPPAPAHCASARRELTRCHGVGLARCFEPRNGTARGFRSAGAQPEAVGI